MVADVKKYTNGSIRIKIDYLDVDFFDKEDYIIKTFDNSFSLSKPNLDYVGKTHKITRKKDNYITISTVKQIEVGTYILDEESNEDVAYFINSNYLEK